MFTLQKSLKHLFEICQRRDITRLVYRCSDTRQYLSALYLPSNIKPTEYDIMPKKNKKVKIDWIKVTKLISANKKKTELQKNIKEKKRAKKKLIVSQFLAENNTKKVKEDSDSDDVVIIFDSTERKRKETEVVVTCSSESEDSVDMGNVNSDALLQTWTSSNGNYFISSEQTSSQIGDSSVIDPDSQPQPISDSHQTDGSEMRKLKSFRQWKYTKFGSNVAAGRKSSHLVFTLLSYNVLAQDLLESHPYLYRLHKSKALTWEYRSRMLLREIKELNADIMCLQEVQQSHMDSFYSQLNSLGYEGIFKQRTGHNIDGVAIYYKKDLFELLDYTSVEYFQPGVEILNRDNVGLIAKLAVKRRSDNGPQHIVVATTHLLFNPKRHDVKLAQTQLLLAELERYAFQGIRFGAAVYWPVIVTGDMNFEPKTGVYRLLTEGMLQFEGLSARNLTEHTYEGGQILNKTLLPRNLDILDTCQHWGILCKRMIEKLDHKTELRLLRLHNTDHERIMKELNMSLQAPRSFEDFVENARSEGLINNFVPFFGSSSIPPMPDAGYGTGQLTHNLNLRSVYSHNETDEDKAQVTTYQNRWVKVDYIFYSQRQKMEESSLKLIAKYRLPNAQEAASMGPIPNMASPSDHYPLMAAFYLKL